MLREIVVYKAWKREPSKCGRPARTLRFVPAFRSLIARLVVMQIPAHAARAGGVVVLALDHVLRAALIEAENFVVEVEAVSIDLKTRRQPVACLGVELEVAVEVEVE
jgi:hypothetical protein